jgi:hypothetical protein
MRPTFTWPVKCSGHLHRMDGIASWARPPAPKPDPTRGPTQLADNIFMSRNNQPAKAAPRMQHDDGLSFKMMMIMMINITFDFSLTAFILGFAEFLKPCFIFCDILEVPTAVTVNVTQSSLV